MEAAPDRIARPAPAFPPGVQSVLGSRCRVPKDRGRGAPNRTNEIPRGPWRALALSHAPDAGDCQSLEPHEALSSKRRERERRLAAERKRCHGEERLSYRALQRRRFCEWHQTDLNPRALPHVTLGFGAVAREILVKRSARPVYPQAPGSAARAGERRYSRDPRWHMTKKRPSSARLQPKEASHFIPARGTFLRE